MILGFKVDTQLDLVNALIDEWNELFTDPTRRIISETLYYKRNDKLPLNDGIYIMSIKPMFPYIIWLTILGTSAMVSFIFEWFIPGIILTTLLLFMTIFFIPYLYFLGTKSRLKRRGYNGSIKYLAGNEVLRTLLKEAYPDEN